MYVEQKYRSEKNESHAQRSPKKTDEKPTRSNNPTNARKSPNAWIRDSNYNPKILRCLLWRKYNIPHTE